MPEPTKRPSLLDQKKLNDSYKERMKHLPRRASDSDTIEIKVVQEPVDAEFARIIKKFNDFLDMLEEVIKRSNDLTPRTWMVWKNRAMTLDLSKLENYSAGYDLMVALIMRLENILSKDLPYNIECELDKLLSILEDALD